MVIRKDERAVETIVNMRGGEGQVVKTELLPEPYFCGHGRLYAKFCLEPGSSIGKHPHEGESETYYILAGKAKVDDNGTEVIAEAGDIIHTASMQAHSIMSIGDEPLEFLGLIVNA